MSERVCPKCKSTDGFWVEVEATGWKIATIADDGTVITSGRLEDSEESFVTTYGGCSECQWEGDLVRETLRVGNDGEPLGEPLPGQETMLDE